MRAHSVNSLLFAQIYVRQETTFIFAHLHKIL
jgi:hypothetical protein